MYRFIFLILSVVVWSCQEEANSMTDQPKTITTAAFKDTVAVEAIVSKRIIDYDTTQWAELIDVDTTIVLDMRYATTNNFVSEVLYDCARCFLRPEASAAVASANKKLQAKGYRLKMYDCFRPLPVQQKLWDKFQNPSYVTPPSKGSMHNRGLAVDLTIVDAAGKELNMGTTFDFFGPEAHHTYTGHSEEINEHRALLKSTMEAVGFKGIRTEWWHYYFGGIKYELSDMLWACEE